VRVAFLCALGLGVVGAGARVAAADVPQKLNDEGRLFDATSGMPVTGSHTLKFLIYAGSSGGTALWTQTSTVMLNNGFFAVTLDGSSTASTPFPAGVFDGTELYLTLAVDSDAEMTPRQPLDSVPYAMVASNAIGDITPHSVSVGGQIIINATGDITPHSVSVGGQTIINATGDVTPNSVSVGGTVITSTGNVGVGIASPQSNLDVSGYEQIEGAGFTVPFSVARFGGTLDTNGNASPFSLGGLMGSTVDTHILMAQAWCHEASSPTGAWLCTMGVVNGGYGYMSCPTPQCASGAYEATLLYSNQAW
jgi:hypothetical protein